MIKDVLASHKKSIMSVQHSTSLKIPGSSRSVFNIHMPFVRSICIFSVLANYFRCPYVYGLIKTDQFSRNNSRTWQEWFEIPTISMAYVQTWELSSLFWLTTRKIGFANLCCIWGFESAYQYLFPRFYSYANANGMYGYIILGTPRVMEM